MLSNNQLIKGSYFYYQNFTTPQTLNIEYQNNFMNNEQNENALNFSLRNMSNNNYFTQTNFNRSETVLNNNNKWYSSNNITTLNGNQNQKFTSPNFTNNFSNFNNNFNHNYQVDSLMNFQSNNRSNTDRSNTMFNNSNNNNYYNNKRNLQSNQNNNYFKNSTSLQSYSNNNYQWTNHFNNGSNLPIRINNFLPIDQNYIDNNQNNSNNGNFQALTENNHNSLLNNNNYNNYNTCYLNNRNYNNNRNNINNINSNNYNNNNTYVNNNTDNNYYNYNNVYNNSYKNNINSNNYNNYNNYNNNNTYLNNNINNSNINYNDKITQKKTGINFLTKPKGLLNVGATCYMNATLQCFYHVKELSNYLLEDNIISFLEMPITYSFKDLVKKLSDPNYIDEYDSVKPEKFKQIISKMNPLFAGIQANDSKDLILFLLEKMDNELLERNKKFNINNKQKTIIGDLFHFKQRCSMKCCNCNYRTDNIQIMNFLIFPLEHIYKHLNKYFTYYSFFQKTPHKPSVTLDDCFESLEKEEKLTGDNQMYCDKCYQMSDAINGDMICSSPKILILVLNRGKGNCFDCDVKFDYKLDIGKFNENKNEVSNNYDLIGVISHLGESSMSGHFLAFCKHFDDKWYCFNDGIVSPLNSNDDIYKGVPYILFYQKNRG